jgi:alkanesulfonate monooxygenase SsuD/methylene tetrahydromethanopterin reductase-like flavin-dependent oxidoreductase (luciferase family)
MIRALRPVAWAIKQIATPQNLSGGRVVLGVGTGGVSSGGQPVSSVAVHYSRRGEAVDS